VLLDGFLTITAMNRRNYKRAQSNKSNATINRTILVA